MYDPRDYDKHLDMEPFERALDSLLGTLDADGSKVRQQGSIARTFREVAGPTVDTHVRNVLFDEGRVTVVMDSGIWAQELAFLVDQYREGINHRLGGDVVTSIRFCTRPMR